MKSLEIMTILIVFYNCLFLVEKEGLSVLEELALVCKIALITRGNSCCNPHHFLIIFGVHFVSCYGITVVFIIFHSVNEVYFCNM